MAFYKQDIVDVNLETGVIHRSFLNHTIGHKDDDADRFGIRAFRNGEPVDLSGAQCQAVFMAPDGTNIALTSYGTVSGNEAYVTLPQACYNVEGQFCLAIKLVGGGVTATVRIIDGVVDRTGATGAVAPTEAVPTYQEILAVYADMQEDVADYESVVATQNGKIDDLKSAFDMGLSEIAWSPAFKKGEYIKVSNGKTASDTKYARTWLWDGAGNIFAVNLSGSTYQYLAAFYDASGNISTGAGFIGASGSAYGSGTIYIPSYAVKFGLSFRRADQAVLSDSDITAIGNALTAYFNTDETLSKKGIAADAKATGDKLTEEQNTISNIVNDDYGDFFEDIIPELGYCTWSVTDGYIDVETIEGTSYRIGNTSVITTTKPYYVKSNNDYLMVLVEIESTTYPAKIIKSTEWTDAIEIIPGKHYFVGVKTADESTILRRNLYSGIADIGIVKLYNDVKILTDNYDDAFVKHNQARVRNYRFNVNVANTNISFNSNSAYLMITEPVTVDYDLILSCISGYQFALLLMKDATSLVNDINISTGWINYAKVKKNTPFYIQIKRDDGNNIALSEFSTAIKSKPSDSKIENVVDLMLFAGQSNMAGRGITSTQWPQTYPTIIPGAGYEYRAITNTKFLVPIAEPFGVNENNTNGINDGSLKTGSMVTSFANAYYTHNGGVPVVGVSASKGGSGIDEWQPGEAYYNDAVARITAAKNWLDARGYKVRETYLVWCQGEHEGATPDPSDDNNYINSFNTMFAGFKSNGIGKCLLCRIGESNASGEDYSIVIQKQTELAQNNPDVIMVTTTLASFKSRGLMKDEFHYYQAAYNEMGDYAGTNSAMYVNTGKEPTMYDPKYSDLYYSHIN